MRHGVTPIWWRILVAMLTLGPLSMAAVSVPATAQSRDPADCQQGINSNLPLTPGPPNRGVDSLTDAQLQSDIAKLRARIEAIEKGGIAQTYVVNGRQLTTVVVTREDFADALTVAALAGEIDARDIPAVTRGAQQLSRERLASAQFVLRILEGLRNDRLTRPPPRPSAGADFPFIPDLSGAWQGGNGTGSRYSFTQRGVLITWTRSDNDEIGTATIVGGGGAASISASYRSSGGSGSAEGTVIFDSNRRPVGIRWSNGDVYVRR